VICTWQIKFSKITQCFLALGYRFYTWEKNIIVFTRWLWGRTLICYRGKYWRRKLKQVWYTTIRRDTNGSFKDKLNRIISYCFPASMVSIKQLSDWKLNKICWKELGLIRTISKDRSNFIKYIRSFDMYNRYWLFLTIKMIILTI